MSAADIAARPILDRLLAAALAAVDPARCLPAFVPAPDPAGRTLVGGAGKAAASMAEAFVRHYDAPVSGVVVTRYGHGLPAGQVIPGIEVLEAGHPVPDQASVAAGTRVLQLACSAGPADRFVFLISGGASALLVAPAAGVTLADKQAVTRELLAAGAPIDQINSVRRKLSAVKGGRLAAACHAREILVLALSDVPGDNPADIGSGPLSPDPTTLADARRVLGDYRCAATPAVWRALGDPRNESAPAGDPGFGQVTTRIIARSADAVAAAARAAESAGFRPLVLAEARGPARDLAAGHARQVRQLRAAGGRWAVISGGETTVEVRNPAGRGGRNTEYLLALAIELGPSGGIHALAADTDGIDGTGAHAGACLTPGTLARAAAAGLDAAMLLENNRSGDFFAALADLVVTGPTRTNANDLRVLLVDL